MPIVLSEKDLAPLYSDPGSMTDLIALIEDSMRAQAMAQMAGSREWKPVC